MAYQNGTTHYNLPQTIGTDKRDWSDTNKAFADVDAALYNAANGASINKTDIDKLKIDVAANTQQITTNTDNIATNTANIGTNTGNISKLQSDLQTAQTDLHNEIVDVRNDAEDMITAYNEPNATSAHKYAVGDYFIYNDILYKATQAIDVGNTIVPNTNCTATNVTTELKGSHSASFNEITLEIPSGQTWTNAMTAIYNQISEHLNRETFYNTRLQISNPDYPQQVIVLYPSETIEGVGNIITWAYSQIVPLSFPYYLVQIGSTNTYSSFNKSNGWSSNTMPTTFSNVTGNVGSNIPQGNWKFFYIE